MEKTKAVRFAAAGAVGLIALTAAALALAPERRGLASLDLDDDGQITNAEIQQSARRRFVEMDANGDGRLTGEELPRDRHGRGHGRHGPHHDRHDGDILPRTAPAAVAGGAPQVRVDPGTEPAAGPVQAQPVRRGLARADLNSDGALDLREFYVRYAARAGRADNNRDGTISAEELATFRPRRGRHGD